MEVGTSLSYSASKKEAFTTYRRESGLPGNAMTPQPTRTLLSIDDQGHRLEVDSEAFHSFRQAMEVSLAALEAKWAAWAPPVAQKADRQSQFGR